MTTEALEKELAQESTRLSDAQAQAEEAAKQLAKDPSNAQRRLDVMKAQQAVAEVQVSIDALSAAQAESKKIATQEAQDARAAETLAVLKQAKALIAQRPEKAQAIDAVLSALHDALSAWKVLNDEATKAALDFHAKIYGGPSRYSHALPLMGMSGVVSNTLVSRVCAALVENVPGAHRYFSFNHTTYPDGPDSVEEDARQSSERYLSFLEETGQTQGID